MSSEAKYKPYQVPKRLYLLLEQKATEIRKQTGKNISWSVVLRQILEKELQK